MYCANSPDNALLQSKLDLLYQQCQDALETYKRTKDPTTQSPSCTEIVRRAALGDDQAIGVLLYDLSYKRIEEWCRSRFASYRLTREEIEEVQQQIALRLVRRFKSTSNPYAAGAIGTYFKFLYTSTLRYVIDMRRKQTVEVFGEETEQTPSTQSVSDDVEKTMLFERFIELLPTAQLKDVFRRRFSWYQSPDEIAQALGLQKREVFRLIEQTIKVLKNNPEIRDMFED